MSERAYFEQFAGIDQSPNYDVVIVYKHSLPGQYTNCESHYFDTLDKVKIYVKQLESCPPIDMAYFGVIEGNYPYKSVQLDEIESI